MHVLIEKSKSEHAGNGMLFWLQNSYFNGNLAGITTRITVTMQGIKRSLFNKQTYLDLLAGG